MEYIKLGATDLRLSVITYGSFAIGGTMWGGTDEADSIAAVRASIDNGITSIDTAPFYGFGLSEEMIGKAIKGYDRSRVQLLTKFGLVWDGSNAGRGERSGNAIKDGKTIEVYKYTARENILKEVEESLRRLDTDYIDLLQLHWPDNTTPISETMETLDLLVKQGKIRAAAVCNYSVEQLEEAAKSIQLASNQVPYNMLNRRIEEQLVPYALEHNLGIIAYSPMARGLLTGKYFEGGQLKADDHRNEYFSRFNLVRVEKMLNHLKPLAAEKQATLAQLVLRWTTQQKGISVVLAGARNAEQAISNAAAMSFSLSDDELLFIAREIDACTAKQL